ncbi:O-methyltransferase [uncultured Veillonella sp.]|uniref:O-methyltransferase n=1 Tax=uncultured Veillonella sp. TaxID=159268 RepID=UPI002632AFB7|nr:O-methyltransferase [uncultured Veillonella sp.]
MELKDILNEQRIYAVLNKVPILRESEVHLFEELISLYKPSRILEVGTAIGYSTLLLGRHSSADVQIDTIELDGQRYGMAQQFIGQSKYKDQISLHLGDANEVLLGLEGPYDLVFLDGPKGQYKKQLEIIEPHLAPQAVVLADNVLFRGYVRGHKEAPHRYKTIIKRLRDYLEMVEDKTRYNTTIYPLGDGMSVSVWKGNK